MNAKQDAMERAKGIAYWSVCSKLGLHFHGENGPVSFDKCEKCQLITAALLAFHKEGLEEAAKVASSFEGEYGERTKTARDIAKAIRRLEE